MKTINGLPTVNPEVGALFIENSKIVEETSWGQSRAFNSPTDEVRLRTMESSNFKSYTAVPSGRRGIGTAPKSFVTLDSALASRHSVREFSDAPPSWDELRNVLANSLTARRVDSFQIAGTTYTQRFFPYPTGGGLRSCEVYLVTRNVSGLPDGFHFFDSTESSLILLTRSSAASTSELLQNGFVGQSLELALAAPISIFISAVFPRVTTKYRQRGYRFALLEAGHLAQTIMLAAESVGLGTCGNGGFVDDTVNDWLQLDGVDETVVHCICLGRPRGVD